MLSIKRSHVGFASAFFLTLSSTVFWMPQAVAQEATANAAMPVATTPASGASSNAFAALNASNAMADTAASGELQTVEVVSTAPVGPGTSVLNVPSETQTLSAQQIDNLNQITLQDTLARSTPGVSVTDEIGSPLSQSVDFRGETASPVPGTPEGLAVYMNGVRINEAYGDVVNWDLIPQVAMENAQIVTGNPVFGLNAIAGAVVINMKNGFNWQGTEFDAQGGSLATVLSSLQYGWTNGTWAYYAAMEGTRTDGYRLFGQSDVERGYADIGYRAGISEVHLSVTGAADALGVAGTTPIQQIAEQGPQAVFTTPQTTDTTAIMATLSDETHISSTLTFNGNMYFRDYAQAHVDGNVSDFYSCTSPGSAEPEPTGSYVCNQGAQTGANPGGVIPGLTDPDLTGTDGQPLGEIDSNWTHTYSTGATAQLTDTDKILGHNNTITAGVSVDHGWTHFTGSSTLGTLPPDFVVPVTDEIIDEPTLDVAPVDLGAQNTYVGVYVLDDFDVTDRLTLHAGARFNDAQLDLQNELSGTAAALAQAAGTYDLLNSSANYARINPVVGATFKITPDISAYASYSEANRAPTPLELGCSNPSLPCMIDNFLVADPPLQQIVARTFEAGLKGSNAIAWPVAPGRLDWSVSAYRTVNSNDIYAEASIVNGFGYYQNVGDTLRQGVDIGATYTADKWDAYASYSYIQATFQTPANISSPNNPNDNCFATDGTAYECVVPGDNIPGIPNHKFKIGFDYEVLPKWKIGADVVYRSSEYYYGDEINSFPPISGFATLNLRTSYQATKNIEIFGLVNNALDYRGATYGTLYETDSTQNQVNGNPPGVCDAGLFCSADPRAITITPPVEIYGGIKVTMDIPPPAPPLVTAKY
jgi:iron complex outermembrane recepter protein